MFVFRDKESTLCVFLFMLYIYVCIHVDTDLYTAYMSLRGAGGMHRDRDKSIALCHPSETQPGLLPLTDPVSIISG